jgi:filamentous hemagglutinin
MIDNYAGMSTKTNLGNNATLYQLDGSLNGVLGRFEWIIQNGKTTHRMFIPKGTMNGVPIRP